MWSTLFGILCVFSSYGLAAHAQGMLADTVKRSPDKFRLRPDSVGPVLVVGRIVIVGNRLTRDHIIERELTLKTGDRVYSNELPHILDLDRKKLFNTRLFNTVEVKPLDTSTNLIDLLVDITERWYTFPAPIFEFSDRNFNEWWQNYNHDFHRVNYGLRLYQYNMRGRNETLRLTAQFGFVRKFDISYRMPYIDKKRKQGLVFEMDYQETKNLAFRTLEHKLDYRKSPDNLKTTKGIALTYTYRNSFYRFHNIRLEYRDTRIVDSVRIWNPNYLGEEGLHQHFASISYSFTSDQRDYFAYPLRGHHFNFFILKSGLGLGDNLNRFETGVSYSKFIPLKRNYFFSANVVGSLATPDDLPYTNYNAMGFRKQFVRGYEVYVIEGPYFFLGKTTFKKLLLSRKYHWRAMPIEQFRHIPIQIYLKSYVDLGYVRNYPYYRTDPQSSYDGVYLNNRIYTDKLLSGAGGGIDIVGSYDTVLRFEYTFNGDGQRGFFFHVKREF
jgi:outer membrane protein assembly factor BamA